MDTGNIQIATSFIEREEHELDFMSVIENCVKPGWICVDIGACMGSYTFLFATLTGGDGQVYSFDAFIDNVQLVQNRSEQACLTSSVAAAHCAVTDGKEPEVWLHPGREHSRFEWNIVGQDVTGAATPATMRVPAVSMDQFFADKAKPQIIKIDVEGSGVGVLKGMQQILSSPQPPIILMELHGPEERQALFECKQFGYEIWNIDSDEVVDRPENIPYHAVAIPKTM